MLTGTELLQKIQSLGDAPRDQVAIACGYTNDKGKPLYTAFYEAMLQAKGLTLAPPTGKAKGRGKPPSWETTVSKVNSVSIGAAYTTRLGLVPGQTVKIGHEGSRLWLEAAPVAASSASEAPAACVAPVTAAGVAEAALAPF